MQGLKPIKERLNGKLKKSEEWVIKQGLYAYLAKEDPNLQKTTIKNLLIEKLLPHFKFLSPLWDTVEEKDFSIGNPLIKQVYTSITNSLQTPNALKKHISDYIKEQESESEESEQTEVLQPVQTRGQEKQNISAGSSTKGRYFQTSVDKNKVQKLSETKAPQPNQVTETEVCKENSEQHTVSLQNASQFNFKVQYAELALKRDLKKREIKALDKEMDALRSQMTQPECTSIAQE